MIKYSPHIALFIGALIQAFFFITSKVALETMPPDFLTFLRVFMGFVILLAFQVLFIKQRIDKSDYKRLTIIALVGVVLTQVFFFRGMSLTSPVHGSLIMALTPIMVVLVSKRHLDIGNKTGVLLSFLGVVLLVLQGGSLENFSLLGDLFLFLTALCYAYYLVLLKSFSKYNPITLVTFLFGVGALALLPLGLIDLYRHPIQDISATVLGAIIFIVLGATVFMHLINAFALKKVSASAVSAFMYLTPVFAFALAVVFEKDSFSLEKVIAVILVLSGVFLATKISKIKKQLALEQNLQSEN